MVVVEIAKLRYSLIDLPEHLEGAEGYLYMIGETKDGKLCIVYVDGLTLHTWFRRVDDAGVHKWMLHDAIPLEREIVQATKSPSDEHGLLGLQVWAVLDGVVYMSTLNLGDPDLPSWFLSFCLETKKLEKLFERKFDNRVFPYLMAWPPCLVGGDTS